MRSRRAAWIGLNTASYICEVIFLGLAMAVQISPDWALYDVTYIGSVNDYNQLSRSRGLWKQCVTNEMVSSSYNGQCYALEPFGQSSTYNAVVQPILSMRTAINALQIITIILVFIIIVITCVFLILTWKRPEKFKPRTGQYTALGGGSALWFTGLIYFISLLIYYEDMSQENYRLDSTLTSARSAWSVLVRENTIYLPGGMIPMAWSACVLIYAGSFFQLIASALQQPPSELTQ
uniref:Methionine aminopeptidase 1 n=1 Tax=Schistosoma japonicum TaxID=6182 RepID=C1LFP1_SCHJA|nr:Methionine aminopeptidase 1 [Schistosoma japonicum]